MRAWYWPRRQVAFPFVRSGSPEATSATRAAATEQAAEPGTLLERASGPPPPRTLAVLWWPASSLFSGLHPLRRGDHPMASTRCAEKHPSLALTPSALTPPALTSSGPRHALPLHTLHLLPCGAQCGGSVAPYSWRQLMAAYHHCGEARYLQLR